MQTHVAQEDRSFAPEEPAKTVPEPGAPRPQGEIPGLVAAYDDLTVLYAILLEDADAREQRYLELVAETGDFGAARDAQREALRHICGLCDAEQRAEEAGVMLAEIETRIVAAPAITFDDLRLKALILRKSIETQSPHIEIDYDGALRALVRDIAGSAAA